MTTIDDRADAPEAVVVMEEPGHRLSIGHGELLRALERNTTKVVLPVLGELHLPPRDQLVWLAGLGTLAAVGVLEWPVAVAIGAGHLLAHQQNVRVLRVFGEALEEA